MDISRVERVSITIWLVTFEAEEVAMRNTSSSFGCTTGSALYELLTEILREVVLCLHNLKAQCYDGAANTLLWVLASWVKEVEPRAMYFHCHAHILNLVLADASQSISEVCNTLGTVAVHGYYIEGSAKRHNLFVVQKESGSST